MFLPDYEGNPEDWDAFLEFCESWLCQDPNDNCYNGDYDHNNDDIVNFADFAYFASVWDMPSFTETHYYYLHDALGSVRGLIGGKFNREEDREFYNYDVYGKPSDASAVGNPYMFAAYYHDTETGLYYLRARHYDPATGRFIQLDEDYYDSMNLYEYVMSDPMNYTDPWGLYGDKWYQKLWENTKRGGMYIGIGLWELPGAYIETGVSGEQYDSLNSCCDKLVNGAIPFYDLPLSQDPLYANKEASRTGGLIGSAGSLAQNAVMAGYGICNLPSALAGLEGLCGCANTVQAATCAGPTVAAAAASAAGNIACAVKAGGCTTAGIVNAAKTCQELKKEAQKKPETKPEPKPEPKNPHGSKGKPDHQNKVNKLKDKAMKERKPGETVRSGEKIRNPNSNRRPDQQIVDKNGNARKVYEAERHPSSARNRLREAEYDWLGIEHETHPLD